MIGHVDDETGEVGVREVTDEEVALYTEQGWVKLDGLITSDLAGTLLREAEVGAAAIAASEESQRCVALDQRQPPFRSLVQSRTMGRNAQRLVNRRRLADTDTPIQYRTEYLECRNPGTGMATPYHQDAPEIGSDRVGEFNLWIALSEVTPDMGAMRFVTGSHREGPLGTILLGGPDSEDLLDRFPKLLDLYDLCPPPHYQPGDATVHHGHMIHGAPENTGSRPRWSYIVSYAPADTRYFNGDPLSKNGSKRLPMDDAQFPIVYPAVGS